MDFALAIRAVAEERPPLHAVVAHSFGGAATMVAHLEAPIASGTVLLAPAAEPAWFTDRAADLLGVPLHRRAGMKQRVEVRAGRRYEDIDLRLREGALSLPVLVLHDPADAEVPIAHGEAAARVSVRGRLEPLPGLGHRRLLRDPGVVERIGRFVAGEIPPAGRTGRCELCARYTVSPSFCRSRKKSSESANVSSSRTSCRVRTAARTGSGVSGLSAE